VAQAPIIRAGASEGKYTGRRTGEKWRWKKQLTKPKNREAAHCAHSFAVALGNARTSILAVTSKYFKYITVVRGKFGLLPGDGG
jgi:hypothetical protein